ncbi:hypothetical protein D3C77_465050 [compost metagenome]
MQGALLLNVSLRDFKSSIYSSVREGMIVDDWDEVCRENTDVERMALTEGLTQQQVISLSELFSRGYSNWDCGQTQMFNPMGMAVFDIATASYYVNEAKLRRVGQNLES